MERLSAIVIWCMAGLGLYALIALAMGVLLPSEAVPWMIRGTIVVGAAAYSFNVFRKSRAAAGLVELCRRLLVALAKPVGEGGDDGGAHE
jgi:hypothetical protein